ncbi:unnamed protein product [Blepharisma stoltei]|uniref:PPM-type phosphatase domain-containing protein n=1 Tax=Blepharisma stoltei TaxID=1481888 RepID=A0AAU9IPA7_9CILI|nr:unnamed protein product [Blepharisma stoltei]
MLNKQRTRPRMNTLQTPSLSSRTIFKDPIDFLISNDMSSELNIFNKPPKTCLPDVFSSRSTAIETSRRRTQFKRRTCIPCMNFPIEENLALTLKSPEAAADDGQILRLKSQSVLNFKHPLSVRNKKASVISYNYKSKIGESNGIYKKCNQDTYIAKPLFHQVNEFYLFTVCDGHGPSGHEVSHYIREMFPRLVEAKLKHRSSTLNDLEDALNKSIKKLTDQIDESKMPTESSGSTMNCVLINGNKLICANIGDSRAVLGSLCNSWKSKDLSRDHKPTEEDEKNRIIQSNGILDQVHSPIGKGIGPLRVWQSVNNHGLAMSRSIGDTIAHGFGVSSEPEFTRHHLTENDKFLIVASDGIWDVISSEEAVKIVGKVLDKDKREACCDALINEAARRWKHVHNNSVDDITVIVVFFGLQKLSLGVH